MAVMEIVWPLIGACIGGVCAVVASLLAVKRVSLDLEANEIRRQRVLCLVSLCGLRFVMSNELPYSEYDRQLMYELNKVSSLWAHDQNVMKSYRDYFSNPSKNNFVTFLKAISATTELPLDNLADSDLKDVFIRKPPPRQ